MRKDFSGELIQLTGVLLMGSGITMEMLHGGNLFMVIITVGCVIFTIGTKIKGR